ASLVIMVVDVPLGTSGGTQRDIHKQLPHGTSTHRWSGGGGADALQHGGAESGWVYAQGAQGLDADALALGQQAEQQVLGADVVVAEFHRLPQGELQHLLGPHGVAGPGELELAGAEGVVGPPPDLLYVDADGGQGLGGLAAAVGADAGRLEQPQGRAAHPVGGDALLAEDLAGQALADPDQP